MRATAHKGPKGGTEYRLWTGDDTYRVVGKYKALPHMTPEERARAEGMEAMGKAAKRATVEAASAWRGLMRGG